MNHKYRNWFRYYSVASLLVILAFGLIGFSYVPAISANLPTPWLGATERVNIYGWMLWVAVLAVVILGNFMRDGTFPTTPAFLGILCIGDSKYRPLGKKT